jgi:GTPase Era involved in 16S rRNA processing
MENNVSNFLLTLENKENKKKCNLNVFNYIMQLEEKEKLEKMQNEKKELPEENKIIDKSKEITNQIQELEEQIQNLTLEQEKYEDRTKITPEQLQNIYKTDKSKLFEDFKKINSKYI